MPRSLKCLNTGDILYSSLSVPSAFFGPTLITASRICVKNSVLIFLRMSAFSGLVRFSRSDSRYFSRIASPRFLTESGSLMSQCV